MTVKSVHIYENFLFFFIIIYIHSFLVVKISKVMKIRYRNHNRHNIHIWMCARRTISSLAGKVGCLLGESRTKDILMGHWEFWSFKWKCKRNKYPSNMKGYWLLETVEREIANWRAEGNPLPWSHPHLSLLWSF